MTTPSPSSGTRPGRVLRVFFDWGHPWPLWESFTDKYTMEPTDYGYSAELIKTLRQWQAAWVPIADFDLGETEEPPSAEAYQRYEDLGRRALTGILTETPAEIPVSIEQHDAPRPDRP